MGYSNVPLSLAFHFTILPLTLVQRNMKWASALLAVPEVKQLRNARDSPSPTTPVNRPFSGKKVKLKIKGKGGLPKMLVTIYLVVGGGSPGQVDYSC